MYDEEQVKDAVADCVAEMLRAGWEIREAGYANGLNRIVAVARVGEDTICCTIMPGAGDLWVGRIDTPDVAVHEDDVTLAPGEFITLEGAAERIAEARLELYGS